MGGEGFRQKKLNMLNRIGSLHQPNSQQYSIAGSDIESVSCNESMPVTSS